MVLYDILILHSLRIPGHIGVLRDLESVEMVNNLLSEWKKI